MKILCVDDDASILEIIKAVLEDANYEVITAVNGLEGLELFKKHEAELGGIFLDLRMPGLDGISLLTKIRETSSIPAVAVSAYLDKVRVGDCEKAGFNAHINKPFDTIQFLDAARLIFVDPAAKKK